MTPPIDSSTKAGRRALRDALREARRALTPRQRQAANARLVARVARERAFRHATRIAAYLPGDGEVDVRPLVDLAHAAGKQVYLPIIRPDWHLDFARYAPGTRLEPNRVGILEPARAGRRLIAPMRLQLVLTPLVGFDSQANRLGMGGGFYDRTFAPLTQMRHWSLPRLLGVAWECQRLEGDFGSQPWDVPLWRVITEAGAYMRGK